MKMLGWLIINATDHQWKGWDTLPLITIKGVGGLVITATDRQKGGFGG